MLVARLVLLVRAAAACGVVERLANRAVVLVARAHSGHLAARQGVLDEVVEPVAVSLLERLPLCLAVIGQDHEPVRPGGKAPALLDPRELLVRLRSASRVSARSSPEWWATSS